MPGPPLAVLGVCLTAVVALVAAAGLGRRRRPARRPGAFRGAARVVEGRADGLHARRRACYGRWVQDVFVFVWTSAPLLLRTALLPVDAVSAPRPLAPNGVRRPRHLTAVTALTAPRALLEVAVRAQDEPLACRRPAANPTGITRSPRDHLRPPAPHSERCHPWLCTKPRRG
ncbi:hypothetical protein ABZ733_34520 [Streptomyces longwoodensis]|uniref:hypothetical protein n=1 Tax=Streptomyces longwoodensis TaxID=68231 RepID=UPI0033C647F0